MLHSRAILKSLYSANLYIHKICHCKDKKKKFFIKKIPINYPQISIGILFFSAEDVVVQWLHHLFSKACSGDLNLWERQLVVARKPAAHLTCSSFIHV